MAMDPRLAPVDGTPSDAGAAAEGEDVVDGNDDVGQGGEEDEDPVVRMIAAVGTLAFASPPASSSPPVTSEPFNRRGDGATDHNPSGGEATMMERTPPVRISASASAVVDALGMASSSSTEGGAVADVVEDDEESSSRVGRKDEDLEGEEVGPAPLSVGRDDEEDPLRELSLSSIPNITVDAGRRCQNDCVSHPVVRSALHPAESSSCDHVVVTSDRYITSVSVKNDASWKEEETVPTTYVSEDLPIVERIPSTGGSVDEGQETAHSSPRSDKIQDDLDLQNIVGAERPEQKFQPQERVFVGHGETEEGSSMPNIIGDGQQEEKVQTSEFPSDHGQMGKRSSMPRTETEDRRWAVGGPTPATDENERAPGDDDDYTKSTFPAAVPEEGAGAAIAGPVPIVATEPPSHAFSEGYGGKSSPVGGVSDQPHQLMEQADGFPGGTTGPDDKRHDDDVGNYLKVDCDGDDDDHVFRDDDDVGDDYSSLDGDVNENDGGPSLVVLLPREPSLKLTREEKASSSPVDMTTGEGVKKMDVTPIQGDDDDRGEKETGRRTPREPVISDDPIDGVKGMDVTPLEDDDDDHIRKEKSRRPISRRVLMVPPTEPTATFAAARDDDDVAGEWKMKKSAGKDPAREDESDVGTSAAVPGAVAVPGYMFDERESYQDSFRTSTGVSASGDAEREEASDVEMSTMPADLEPITATPVVEDENPVVLVHATPMAEGEGSAGKKRDHITCRSAVRDRRVQLVALVALVAAAIAIAAAAIMGRRTPVTEVGASSFPSSAPTFETDESPRFVQLREVVMAPAVSSVGAQTLEDRKSPQYRALDWLSNEDDAAVSINDTRRIIQRYALAVLYFSTGGEGWTKRDEFLSGAHECDWYSLDDDDDKHGVEHCDSFDTVTSIKLNENNLVGRIPWEMERLTELKELSMWSNQLSGTIPHGIGKLGNLFRLELDDNKLTGTLPTDLGLLTSLQRLYLYSNELSGTIPTHYGNLTSLTRLSLRDNKLNGTLCTEMGRLVGMTRFYLQRNLLSGTIPSQIGLLTDLTSLQLGGNQLTGTVGTELGGLKKLTRLEIFDNNLSGALPPDLGSLTDLTTLSFRQNNLTGPIATELGRLIRLEKLYLQTNNLSGGLPTELGNLANIQDLSLRENNLTGPMITELGRLETLESLYLWGNRLTGTVMSNWGRMGALTELQLQGNLFTGRIPASLARLTKLEHLDLSGNGLVGRIPVEIGVNVTGLIHLNLSRNELTSTVPRSFVNLDFLTALDLLNNSITGDLDFLCLEITNLQTISADRWEVECECCTA